MSLKGCRFFIFGSYPKKGVEANDIDLLVVVPTVSDIDSVRFDIEKLNKDNPRNFVHVTLYTNEEYKNFENKFSFYQVQSEVPFEMLVAVYQICLTS